MKVFNKSLKLVTKNNQLKRFYSVKNEKVLITGCLGQIGSELVDTLRGKYGVNNVIASDVRPAPQDFPKGPFIFCDVNDDKKLEEIVKNENVKITCMIHNAAFLSASSEKQPKAALKLNTNGLHNVLSVAEQYKLKVFIPSSIAAFGPDTPLKQTPDFTIQRPRGIYGIGKVYVELLGEYYNMKRSVDFRSIRYPGVISWKTAPGGGTTDYAVDIFHSALKGKVYDCYLKPDSELPMMYMPDCIKATVDLLEAKESDLTHRTYNVTAFSLTPKILHEAIQKHIPSFKIKYTIDPLRQGFADSWPKSLDDSHARKDWKWKESYDIDAMVKDMLENLPKVLDKF